ncbi:hypothetical protein M422DRAFT_50949 [Sphaerobolus stellatus SS14]|uniref:Uncharacterized protein n=1 Tax=Sphaerobolus stellatus (strain SS14) TaxID=990650 RepID=A0A0C9V4H8_SPHS4|nr:hypothetical protein M422DRAFT_50949 [Sphaerobolus stellatus SS14]
MIILPPAPGSKKSSMFSSPEPEQEPEPVEVNVVDDDLAPVPSNKERKASSHRRPSKAEKAIKARKEGGSLGILTAMEEDSDYMSPANVQVDLLIVARIAKMSKDTIKSTIKALASGFEGISSGFESLRACLNNGGMEGLKNSLTKVETHLKVNLKEQRELQLSINTHLAQISHFNMEWVKALSYIGTAMSLALSLY